MFNALILVARKDSTLLLLIGLDVWAMLYGLHWAVLRALRWYERRRLRNWLVDGLYDRHI